jgi:AmmeMemoRadiSam system protein A
LKLAAELDALILGAAPTENPVQGVVIPDGDLPVCGKIVGAALGPLKNLKLGRVLVISHCRCPDLRGAALAQAGPKTPLGSMSVDEQAIALLEQYPHFARRTGPEDDGALLGVLPFVQRLWPRAKVVLLAIGAASAGEVAQIGRAVRQVLDEETLVIASRSPEEPEAVSVLLQALGKETFGPLLDSAPPLIFPGRFPAIPALEAEDRMVLGRIAVEAVAAAIAGKKAPRLSDRLSARLTQAGGAFVTLYKDGALQGCMGRLTADTLAQAVGAAAHMSATSDPRFDPLLREELPRVRLEVSVPGRFVELDSPEDFEPGRHGLLLSRGMHRGLLLPQVATKYGLERRGFLEALAQKAGLYLDDWEGAKIERFGVEAFEPHLAADC